LTRYFLFHKGERFAAPDVNISYSQRKDLPQPLKDFRAVGFLFIRYQELGKIKQVDTRKDTKSKRIIPVYIVL
jgi:hypothetical protein